MLVSIITQVSYQIEHPPQWKIHDVFHASLLTCYQETDQHGPNVIDPPPDIIEGEPEWQVEQILKARHFGRKKKLQYFVRWKGYSPSHDSWVDHSEIHAPDLINDFYATYPTAVRVTAINDQPPDDEPSHLPSPHKSSPCPSPFMDQFQQPSSPPLVWHRAQSSPIS